MWFSVGELLVLPELVKFLWLSSSLPVEYVVMCGEIIGCHMVCNGVVGDGLMYLLQALIQEEYVCIDCQEGSQEGVMTNGSCCCLGAISLQNLLLWFSCSFQASKQLCFLLITCWPLPDESNVMQKACLSCGVLIWQFNYTGGLCLLPQGGSCKCPSNLKFCDLYNYCIVIGKSSWIVAHK